jgi:hypothetical protein
LLLLLLLLLLLQTVASTMAPPAQYHRVHSIFRTYQTQDSSESESGRDRITVANSLPTLVKTRSASTRNTPSPTKVRGGSTVRGRRLKQAPCLAIDTAAKENDDVVSNPRPAKQMASWNRTTAFAEQSGWIPAKIRELGTGRVAFIQPLTADELAQRQSRRTRKKHNKPESTKNWRGKVIATQSKNPWSPAMSALTSDSEASPKICFLRVFRRLRVEE